MKLSKTQNYILTTVIQDILKNYFVSDFSEKMFIIIFESGIKYLKYQINFISKRSVSKYKRFCIENHKVKTKTV